MKKFIFLSLILCNFAFSLELSEIKPVMKMDLKKALLIMQDKSISSQNKSTKIFKLFDSYFDYDLMARLSLSKQYKTLSKDQQNEFKAIFTDNLKHSFIDNLSYYSDQDIEIKSTDMPNTNRFFLNSQIKDGNGKTYDIVFKFYRNKGDDFLIYDVDILGISIIQTYRSQFSDLSQSASFDDILNRLKNVKLKDKGSASSDNFAIKTMS